MNFDLESLSFGAALSFICVMGLAFCVRVLFAMMEHEAKHPGQLTRNQRLRVYLVASGGLVAQMALVVFLIFKFSPLLKNSFSWALGLILGVFVFSIVLLPLISKKK